MQAAVSVPGVLFSALIGYSGGSHRAPQSGSDALLLFSVFGLAGFFGRSFWGLIAVRFIQGIGTSGILGMGVVLIGDAFTGDARTRAMGINLTGITLVSMTGPIVAGFVAAGGTFRPFLIFLIGFPLAVWASRMPSDNPIGTVERPTRHLKAAMRTMKVNRTRRDYLGILVASLAAVFILHGLGLTVTPLFLEAEFGTSVEIRGFIVGAFQLGVILAAARIGRILSRHGEQRAISFAFWLIAGGAALAGSAPQPWVVGAGLAVAGLGFGTFIPQAQAYAASAAGDEYRGVTVLMWVTVVRLAQVVGPPTGSQIADRVGARPVYFVAAAGMAVLASVWLPLRRSIQR